MFLRVQSGRSDWDYYIRKGFDDKFCFHHSKTSPKKVNPMCVYNPWKQLTQMRRASRSTLARKKAKVGEQKLQGTKFSSSPPQSLRYDPRTDVRFERIQNGVNRTANHLTNTHQCIQMILDRMWDVTG